jgi:hypothetical protein
VALFRRRPADPEAARAREAFRAVAATLDAAQRSLLAAVPTARSAGRPLGEALEEFLAGLARAEEGMPAWRTLRTEGLWRRCAEALVEARAEAERLRREAGPLGYEALAGRLGEVVAPLEEFAEVAREIRRLR